MLKKVVEEAITSHVCSALILFIACFSALYQFVFLFFVFFSHVKSKGGCHGRQLACLTHMIEVAAIYNGPAGATDLTYLRPARLPVPFTQPMRMKVAGWVTLSKAEEPLQIYTIHPSVGQGAFPLARCCCRPDSAQSCLTISSAWEAHRGVVITKDQFVILVSLHHRSHYLGLLSIKKKLLMWGRKCVLCHYATEAIDFILYWFKLNEPEAITPAKEDWHNRADVNYLELLSCTLVETPRLILMLILCVLIAPQHKVLDGVRHFHLR